MTDVKRLCFTTHKKVVAFEDFELSLERRISYENLNLINGFMGLRANKALDDMERWRERISNKIKRAICSVRGEEGNYVVIRKAPRRQVMSPVAINCLKLQDWVYLSL